MKIMCGLRVAVALLTAAMGPALVGQTEEATVAGEQDPRQKAAQGRFGRLDGRDGPGFFGRRLLNRYRHFSFA